MMIEASIVRTKQLVPRAAMDASQTLGGLVSPYHVTERNAVDIKLLMSELHRFAVDDNDCVGRSTCSALVTSIVEGVLSA
jgi:hypothetical protein